MFRLAAVGCLLATLALVPGSAKNYLVTNPLGAPLATPAICSVGEIADELPADVEQGKRPSAESVQKLKRFIEDEVAKRELMQILPPGDAAAGYEIIGSFLEYKRGSGALRFIVGFGAGNAKATLGLRLVEKQTGTTLYGGHFTATVSSGLESGDEAFERIAKDFAKELDKQMEKVRKEAPAKEAISERQAF
jgi:hypothetical protein